ncbi:hypothetical protein GYMLUDRAFT_258848 [Collybiopsis luxurians FD-317 M1]|nr:hypothetical protein GYMLUDRAFT_258848 [Collybiopsis luxurians FD-317 M1]
MNYIAGIHLSHAQGIESIVAASTAAMMFIFVRDANKQMKKARVEGGEITASPQTFLGRIITPIHGFAFTATPVLYLAGVLSNRMEQPQWYQQTSLDIQLGVGALAWTRTAAVAVALFGGVWLHRTILKAIGKQLHFIGRREKSEIVSTGPYKVVRHPMYSGVLAELILLSVAHWSWIPLVSCGICLGAFALKIPIEERLIESDPAMGQAYVEYKKKVPYRLIPYIW